MFSLFALLTIGFAHGATVPLDPSQFGDLNSLVIPDTVKSIVRTIGILTAHRSYQPATPLGIRPGLDLGVEVTFVRLPDDFKTGLENAGLSSSASLPPALPMASLLVHKGLGERFDVGAGYIGGYQGIRILGFDAKYTLSIPYEGPLIAVRASYNTASVLIVENKTYGGELLFSRPMSIGDPYIGFAYRFTTGTITVPIPLPEPFQDQVVTVKGSSGGSDYELFMGAGLQLFRTGIRLTLGGSYSFTGMHTMGVKVDLHFSDFELPKREKPSEGEGSK